MTLAAPVELRSSLAFERRLARGHRVQGIIIMAAFFGASVSPYTRFAWRLRLYWALTSLLRLASERQPTLAAINLEPRAETQRRRPATRQRRAR